MRPKYLASSLIIVLMVFWIPESYAQRGGGRGGASRGGGGAQRGGGASRGGSSQRGGAQRGGGGPQGGGQRNASGGQRGGAQRSSGGGFGGGLSNSKNNPSRGRPSQAGMGPHGHAGNASTTGRPGTGSPPQQGSGAEGAAAAKRRGSDTSNSAGAAAGGAIAKNRTPQTSDQGGAAIGAAANQNPSTAEGLVAGARARPGDNTNAANVSGGYAYRYGTSGTYHASAGALNAQGVAFRANANTYPAYGVAAFSSHANAWQPTNLVSSSLYMHPGYGALARGLGLATQPIPYDYGGNVVIQGDTTYVNGDPTGTTEDFANQAIQLANAGATSQPADDTKWLPLGVFAVCEEGETSSDHIFQLAVDQKCILRGNFHDLKSDAMEAITGSVDKSTQRAAWTIGSDATPVYEVGIANLTKNETPMLVHSSDGQTRQVTLIRLQEPAAQP